MQFYLGDNGILTNATYAKFATEVKTIEEQVKLKQISSNSIYSGSINDLLGNNSNYNGKLLVEDGELKYIENSSSYTEIEWFEKLGIPKSSDYYTIEFDTSGANEKIETQTVRAGKLATKPVNPEKGEYQFLGWYYLREGGTEDNPAYEEIEFNFDTVIENNYSLYAKYSNEAIMSARKNEYFWQEQYIKNITNITFKRGEIINLPDNYWNIKADNNCADIIAYIEDDESGNGTYSLIIISPYTIYANENTSAYFMNFSNLKSIDFGNFNTSRSKTMVRNV